MAEASKQPTNWAWELQKLQTQITNDARQAINVWSQRWQGIFEQAEMHAREVGQESTFVPSAETWGLGERVWTEKPLHEKTADLQEMIDNMGTKVSRMIANKDIEAMDAGWYVAVALSVKAAEQRRLEEGRGGPEERAGVKPEAPSTLEKTPADDRLLKEFRKLQAEWNLMPAQTRDWIKRAYEKAEARDKQPAPGRDYGTY